MNIRYPIYEGVYRILTISRRYLAEIFLFLPCTKSVFNPNYLLPS